MVAVGVSCADLQRHSVAMIADELVLLGIVDAKALEPARLRVARALFPHDFGHYCGIDIHEKGPLVISERSMLTVEPGIYIPCSVADVVARCPPSAEAEVRSALLDIPEGLRGVGMRIEDSLVVLPLEEQDRASCLDGVVSAVLDFDKGRWLRASCSSLDQSHESDSSALQEAARALVLRSQTVSRSGGVLSAPPPRLALSSDPARLSSWYPYATVVTTAFAPKDIEWVEGDWKFQKTYSSCLCFA
jgi:hypothetical protein